ncbi:transposable element Tcb1 transposase [Trichonephila clavipes]|nr:transposable element Tcb1 transposase [Trichonephila clavipes]
MGKELIMRERERERLSFNRTKNEQFEISVGSPHAILWDHAQSGCEIFPQDSVSGTEKLNAFNAATVCGRGGRDCHEGLSLRRAEIGSRVGRNQTTVMRICDCWMQEDTTDRRGRSHPTQCTTSREDRQIVRMAVTDRSVTSRTIAQHIESVTHHSVSARTIRRRLQSALCKSRPLLGLPLTQNH